MLPADIGHGSSRVGSPATAIYCCLQGCGGCGRVLVVPAGGAHGGGADSGLLPAPAGQQQRKRKG